MKKWIIFFVCILALVGCGSETENEESSEESSNQEEQTNEQVEEEEKEETEEQSNEDTTESSEDESETKNDEEQEQDQVEDDNDNSNSSTNDKENQEPLYEMNDVWSFKPINENDAPSEVVLLTIDDGPDGQALEMAKTLNELDAPAIFFVNGIFMEDEESQEIVRQIHEMGFPIGNHTYSHQNLSEVSESEQREEILSLNHLIREVTGEKPEFFRAPHGVNTDFAKQLVEEEGMLLMNWSYGYDFKQGYMEKDAIADIMVNTELLSDGANLLMHDREWTNAALKDIVQGLRDKGYNMLDPDTILLPTDES
ncbi:polysaccharide deacetylase family protein [Alkalibacillus salilacus]|uniref:Peptidoglycan/xylan/chitin deacetylase (PgdA/CDA1 family) n=1 Tax=Alkalibacillus salilacus TaxID=284582 RepID=A0ABT9VGK6_9BACI|nr:polysaccharide deacetylase family protein [Alkalibacillus salilacus]MDQ0160094.1 peptidoglycan/xylan/chitin deacetylase (PgdA/CDA1 family) [Alkalibacillus salilacus]